MKQIYAIAMVAFSALSIQAQTPLNTNGSLETWTDGAVAADGWFMNTGMLTSGKILRATGNAQDGDVYVKLLPKEGNGGNNNVGVTDIDIVGGETYTISYWYKSEGDDFNFRHWAQFRDAGGSIGTSADFPNFQPSDPIAANTSGEWTQVVVTEQAPANAVKIRLNFRNYTNSSVASIDNVIVYQGTPTSSVKQNEIEGLQVYPNPATDVVVISSNSFAEKSVAIFDIVGKKVLETKTTGTVNVSSLNNGVYILKIEENGKVASRKFIKK